MNIPGADKPMQPLEVLYSGAYAQDEWRPQVEHDGHRRSDASTFLLSATRGLPTATPTA